MNYIIGNSSVLKCESMKYQCGGKLNPVHAVLSYCYCLLA